MPNIQIRPRTRSTITINKIKPSPPVGKYPQLRLCGHLGSAPSSANTRITIKIVPSILLPPLNLELRTNPPAGAASLQGRTGPFLHRNADGYAHSRISPVVQVISIVGVRQIHVVVVVPVVSPICWPRVDHAEPITAVLKAWITTFIKKGQTANSESMGRPEVSTEPLFGYAISAVAASLLPVAVIGLPVL